MGIQIQNVLSGFAKQGALWLGIGALSMGAVQAGDLILHPNGFGQHSYAAWKAQQGMPDDSGSSNQALYFQKMTATTTFAAGVAVVEGIEGLPVEQLTGLSWYYRDDGHCGAGAPRWDVRIKPPTGPSYFFFIGCAAMAITDMKPGPNGTQFIQKSFVGPIPAVPGSIITGLEIVFDEGDDQGHGFVFLDNITVQTSTMTKTWTCAADNGN